MEAAAQTCNHTQEELTHNPDLPVLHIPLTEEQQQQPQEQHQCLGRFSSTSVTSLSVECLAASSSSPATQHPILG